MTENGDIKWLLNIQNLWIDNNWEWRNQMITIIYRIYESTMTENGDIKWLLNIQNSWIDNNGEWTYPMITKYTEFMNR